MTETNAVAAARPTGMAFEITKRRMDELRDFVKLSLEGGYAPKGMTEASGICAIIYGSSLGLNPMQALQEVAVINGRPSIFGDAALSLVLASGKMDGTPIEEWEGKPNTDDFRAVCIVKRVDSETCVRKEFSIAMAKKAKLWGKPGPWTSYPARMLQMRALAWALRGAFADILHGMGIGEEVQDYEMKGGGQKENPLPGQMARGIDLKRIVPGPETQDPSAQEVVSPTTEVVSEEPAAQEEGDGEMARLAIIPESYQEDRKLQEEERESLLREDIDPGPMPTDILIDKCEEAGIDTSAFKAALASSIPEGDVSKIATEMERKLGEIKG